jgi:hypothetical protein
MKITTIIKLLKELKLIEFLILKSSKTVEGKFLPYKNSSLEISKNAKIKIHDGRFLFNFKRYRKDPFPSILIIEDNALLNVKSSFRIYKGARVSISKGATLSLGGGYINHNVNLSCFEKIEIGYDVIIA